MSNDVAARNCVQDTRLLTLNRMINNPVHDWRIIGQQPAGKVYNWNR